MKTSRRRKLIRGLGWFIAVTASAAGGALLLLVGYLAFFDYPEMLRANLERELRALSGTPAHIGSINLDLARFAFELRDIYVESDVAGEPTLEVERVWGRLRLAAMLRQELHWDELTVDGLSLRLVEKGDGDFSVQVGTGASAPLYATGVSLAADTVSFTNASIVLENERVPWHLEATELSLAIQNTAFGRYAGKLLYEGGSLTIKNHVPLQASVMAEFELAGRELYLKEYVVRTAFGEANITGKLGFAGTTRGRFDVAAAGDIGPVAETILGIHGASSWASGPAEFRGTLSIEPDNKILEGTVLLPRGALHGLDVSDWKGELFWDRSLLQLSYGEGSVGSGMVRVQLHQPLPVTEHQASVDLDVQGVSLGRIVESYRSVESPVHSTMSGRASFRFETTSPERLHGEFELIGVADGPRGALDPRASPAVAATEPLVFRLEGRVSDGEVEIDSGELETNGLTASLSGLYQLGGSAELLIEVSTEALAAAERSQLKLREAFRSEGDPQPRAFGFEAGRGRARGRLSGPWPELVFDGELSADDVRFRGLDFDTLRARSIVSGQSIAVEDVVARRRDGTLVGSGRLSPSSALGRRDFRADVSFSRWPSHELLRTFGVAVDVAAPLSGDATIRSENESVSASASFSLDAPTVLGVGFDRGEGRVSLDGTKLRAEPLRLIRGGSELGGQIELDVERGTIVGSIEADTFPLSGMDVFGLPVAGRVEARADIAGTLAAPVITLAGRGRDLTLGDVEVGEAFVSAALRDRSVNLRVTMERVASNLALDAQIALDGDYPAVGTLTWRDVDVAPWVVAEAGSLRVASSGEARFRSMRGLSEPLASVDLDATLAQVTVEGDSFRFASVAPVKLDIRSQRLRLEPVDLLQGSSRVTVGGLVDFADERLDLTADGVVSLGVVETLSRSVRGSGEMGLSARLEGEWRGPSLSGYADFDGGSVRLATFPQALGGLRGRVVFDNRTLRVNDLQGLFGSGPVRINGAAMLEGRTLGSVDLEVEATAVRIRYPEGLVATADAELNLLGSADGRVLSGQVTLRDAIWSREYDLVSGILSDREEAILFEELEDEDLLANLQFDVEVIADESLRLRNSVADIDASARLFLRGSVTEPVLLGSSEAVRGEVYFLGQRYDIISGKVDFVDPEKVEPVIDLSAETRVRSYRVELRLTGTLDRFQPELSSDPPLRTVEILRLLAGASERDLTVRGNEEEELAGVGVASLLTERLTQEVGRRAERLFGLDRFSIDPFLVGQFANPTARMSLGKRITPELTINYSTNLNATTEAIILIEYTPEGPMSWILSRDEDGDVGIDVKFRKSF